MVRFLAESGKIFAARESLYWTSKCNEERRLSGVRKSEIKKDIFKLRWKFLAFLFLFDLIINTNYRNFLSYKVHGTLTMKKSFVTLLLGQFNKNF